MTARRALTFAVTAAGTLVVLAPPAAADGPAWTVTRPTTSAPSPTGTEPPLTPGNLDARPWLKPLDPGAVRAAVALAAARPAVRPVAPPVAPRTHKPPREAHGARVTAPRRILGWRPAPRERQQTPWPVQAGQTLSGIAVATGTSVRALARVNRLTDPDRILAGVVLRVPARGTVQ